MASGAMTTTTTTQFAAQLATAWTRLRQRRTQQRKQAASVTAQRSADDETQYELVAVGLAATLSDAQLRSLFDASSERIHSSALALLLPLESTFAQDPQQFHFTLVVVAKLLSHYLELEHANAPEQQCHCIMRELLLPLLRYEHYSCVHAVALAMLQQVVQSTSSTAFAASLAHDVSALLMDESAQSTDQPEHAVSFSALCGALQLLLERAAGASDGDNGDHNNSSAAALAVQTQRVCEFAIACFATAPLFLRAVATQLVPQLLQLAPTSASALADCAVAAWRSTAIDPRSSASIANVMYLLCVLLPRAPELLHSHGLQALTAFALAHNDALLRKQAMHILNTAFTHYASVPTSSSSRADDAAQLVTWQRFLTASDVIHMHEQLHLIEQVWPHVTELLEASLVVVTRSTSNDDDSVGTAPTASALAWPIAMSFDWLQSLLLRVFSHENPVVRRTFLQRFLTTCHTQWHRVSETNAIDASASFASSASFHTFVLAHVLPRVNDAQLYRTARRAALQRDVTDFLAAYLTFELRCHTSGDAQSSSARPSLLATYVDAVYDAVFGPDVSGHSPEALVSMLEVFNDAELQAAVQTLSPSTSTDLLTEAAVGRLRTIMEFRVMRSFPQSIRRRTARALAHALTSGFTRPATLALQSLARVLLALPLPLVIGDDGSTFVRIHRWLQPLASDSGDDDASSRFATALRTAVTQYVRVQPDNDNDDTAAKLLSPALLSRLLLFAASDVTTSSPSAPTVVALQSPLAQFVTSDGAIDSCKLLQLVGAFERDVAEVAELAAEATATRFCFTFAPQRVYAMDDSDDGSNGPLSAAAQCESALRESSAWVDAVEARATAASASADSSSTISEVADDDDDDDGDDALELLSMTALVAAQMATYVMEHDGDLAPMRVLDRVCTAMLHVLAPAVAPYVSAREQTLAVTFLSVVARCPTAVDSLHALQSDAALPLLLTAALNARAGSGSRQYARCCIQYFVARWTLLHGVLRASSFVPPALLQQVFTASLDALPAVGADPHVLFEVVQVLALTLAQLAGAVVVDADRAQRLDELFNAVWGEYSACLAKPDSLTRAVVYCLFQPAFLLAPSLCKGSNSPVKRWFHRVLAFGRVHRPTVVFHLACRVAQAWRAHPLAARWFVDELTLLLLYKEPLVDANDELTSASTDRSDAVRTNASPLAVKDTFVRLVVLSLLDDMAPDATTDSSDSSSAFTLHQLLILQLLERNDLPEWRTQHMVDSDAFGEQLRSWQALCVLSKHVDASIVDRVNELLWRAFVQPHVASMRYFLELFAMRVLLQSPVPTLDGHVLPLLRDWNLMPQVGASLVLVAGFALHNRLDDVLASDSALTTRLVDAVVPWLNAAHGHTRILVQFVLSAVLPRFLHQHAAMQQHVDEVATDTSERARDGQSSQRPLLAPADRHFLTQTAAFLSANKETKRMHRRQRTQLQAFAPARDCSLLGVLSRTFVSDRCELLPCDDALVWSDQFKRTMNDLHAQFNREHFTADEVPAAAPSPTKMSDANQIPTQAESTSATSLVHVQRKIDTSAILLDDRLLPAAMLHDRRVDSTTSSSSSSSSSSSATSAASTSSPNERNRVRQPVILCASLVDKLPNLAGLARTCEIFNAQSLVVPNMRVCDDALFAAISVTANKWVPMQQVRPDNGELVQALTQWKRDGYTIVALEQTATSVCLSTVAFPEKLVLVLGKEAEGVPVDVLQLVDVCVEIPQFGLIRSLNVHVSGAILLWEYTQQRMAAAKQQKLFV